MPSLPETPPPPALRVRVGSCAWTDRSLVACGRFYPPGCSSAEARLRFYASRFPMVEVDASYYAMPSAEHARRWAERTPPGFRFHVKLFRLLTNHPTPAAMLPRDLQPPRAGTAPLYYRDVPGEVRRELWRRFRDALAPLQQAGRLGFVHAQFPPWLLRNPAGHAHVAHCVEQLAGLTVSVEFRNRVWFEPAHRSATLAFERALGVVHTVVDAPQGFSNSVPPVWEATHPRHAYVRLHGRNAATWDVRGAATSGERFNYEYRDAELHELADRVKALAHRGLDVDVAFNTNHEDQGQRHAGRLARALGLSPPGVPAARDGRFGEITDTLLS